MKVLDERLVRSLCATLNEDEVTRVQDMGWTVPVAERALRVMLRDARKWAPLETMGPLFQVVAGAGAYPIVLAAPSGPKAEHEQLTSLADEAYYNRQVKRFWRHHKLWFAGRWHTHPFQDEPLPSPWDIWGTNLDRQEGWFHFCDEYFKPERQAGHVEIIMAGKMTRVWWITTNPDRIRLVTEIPIGIYTPRQEARAK